MSIYGLYGQYMDWRRRRPNNSAHLIRSLDHHAQEPNIPFRNPSLQGLSFRVPSSHMHRQLEEVHMYGPSVRESPYMDRQSDYFWKKFHVWTVSQSVSGRKSIYEPYGPYLKAPCCQGRLGEKNMLATCSWKNEHGNFGNKVNTSNFLKMAP